MAFIVGREQEIKLLSNFFRAPILFYRNNVILYAYENNIWTVRGEGLFIILNKKCVLLNRMESGNIVVKKKYSMHRINNYAFLKLNRTVYAFDMRGDEEFYTCLKKIFKSF